jgi:hypothetical protein
VKEDEERVKGETRGGGRGRGRGMEDGQRLPEELGKLPKAKYGTVNDCHSIHSRWNLFHHSN